MSDFPTIQVGYDHYPYLGLRFPDAAERRLRDLMDIQRVVIHHSVTPGKEQTEEDELATLGAIWSYHLPKGFGGIGYHAVIFPSGRVYLTGRAEEVRAHVEGQNFDTYGVCLVGTFMQAPPPGAQLAAARRFVGELRYGLGRALPLLGHQDLMQTECPGSTWPDWRGLLEQAPNLTSAGTAKAALLPPLEEMERQMRELRRRIEAL